MGVHHAGQLRHESAAEKGERIIRAELKRVKWSAADLGKEAKTHPEKLALAARLRRKTALTVGEIARRLQMESWKSLNNKLYLARKTKRQLDNH